MNNIYAQMQISREIVLQKAHGKMAEWFKAAYVFSPDTKKYEQEHLLTNELNIEI